MALNIQKLASFSDGPTGGNPAGVVICEALPTTDEMQAIAAEVGFSETVFSMLYDGAWRTRYFSPESEVPFCGHATIALGAALAKQEGDGEFQLVLNETNISVSAEKEGELIKAALQSPLTESKQADEVLINDVLSVFNYNQNDFDASIPCGFAQAGATHMIVALKDRETLSRMQYDLGEGRKLMNKHGLVTIAFIAKETPQLFHARNAFASGGVFEDPATGAAAAALGGYLRDLNWPHEATLKIIQGEDMGMRSIIDVDIPPVKGSSVTVSGIVRSMV